MKTTFDLPDGLYVMMKQIATVRGISLRAFVLQALERAVHNTEERPWMSSYGAMAAEADAVYEVDRVVADELSGVDPGEWQ